MQNKQNTILLAIVSTIIFLLTYIVLSNALPSELSSYALIIISFIPFTLLTTCFLKEKIYYLWFIIPILLTYSSFKEYSIIAIFLITLPYYMWTCFKNINTITWTKLLPIDIPIILLFIHVIYLFLIHPFGIGVDFTNDYISGRGYITFLGALLAFVCLSTFKIPSKTLTKILHFCLIILFISSFFSTIYSFLVSEEETREHFSSIDRDVGYLSLATLFIYIILIKYSILDILKRIHILLLTLLSTYGILIGGFRASLIAPCFLFLSTSIIYKRWSTLIFTPIVGLFFISFLIAGNFEHYLPGGVQRTLSIIPFFKADALVQDIASDSVDFRVDMWKYALDDRYNFIQDKVWGDGFSRNIHHLKAKIYAEAYNLRSVARKGEAGNHESDMWLDGWHSGPLATINSLGYIGLSLYIIINVFGFYYAWQTMLIYKNHKYRVAILYFCTNYMMTIILYLLTTGTPPAIAVHIYKLLFIKLLYSAAKNEGLFIPTSTRKEYIPMICRQANSEPA